MAKLQYSTISKRTVESLSVDKDTVFWDRELTGFGVRVYPTGGRVYVAQSRGPDGAKRVTVGRHGVISADQARRRAALIIARIKAGEEPVPAPMAPRNGPTVAELAARYLEEHVAVRCKPATAVQCRQVIDKYIVPELGKVPLAAAERGHVIDLHHKLSGVPAMANLVIATLSRMFNQAEAWELVPDGVNPCRFVHKYQERKRERFLTEEEFRRLGQVLSEAGNGTGVSARAAAAIRLLMLTGCRRNEILSLRWEDVDLDAGELHLSDSKTGARAVPLSPSAAKFLAELPRVPRHSLGVSGQETGGAYAQYQWPVGNRSGAGRDRECTAPRPAAFVCFQGSGARRELADDREIAGTQTDRNDGTLCAFGPRFGEGIGGPDCRQHCRGHSEQPSSAEVRPA